MSIEYSNRGLFMASPLPPPCSSTVWVAKNVLRSHVPVCLSRPCFVLSLGLFSWLTLYACRLLMYVFCRERQSILESDDDITFLAQAFLGLTDLEREILH